MWCLAASTLCLFSCGAQHLASYGFWNAWPICGNFPCQQQTAQSAETQSIRRNWVPLLDFWKARLCLCLCNPTSTYPPTPPTARGRASEKTLQSARGKKGANCKSQREGSRQKKNARSKSNRARRNKRAKENESEPTDSKPASFKSKREGRKHKASPGARERRQESSKTKVR